MNEGFVEEGMDVLSRAIRSKLRIVEGDMLAEIVESISIPVQYLGSRVIRSLPGEKPRTETGDLRDSMDSVIEQNVDGPDTLAVEVFSTDPKAVKLEGQLKRPFMGPAFIKWTPQVVELLSSI